MAYKDTSYTWYAGGCTVSNAAGFTGLFGNVSGLSQLNSNEVIMLMVSASGGDAQLLLSSQSTDIGVFRLTSGASTFDIPPITVANASAMKFSREGANNPVLFWTIMVRTP